MATPSTTAGGSSFFFAVGAGAFLVVADLASSFFGATGADLAVVVPVAGAAPFAASVDEDGAGAGAAGEAGAGVGAEGCASTSDSDPTLRAASRARNFMVGTIIFPNGRRKSHPPGRHGFYANFATSAVELAPSSGFWEEARHSDRTPASPHSYPVMKKVLLPLLLCLSLPVLSRGDEASHRAAAVRILDMVSGPQMMRAAFVTGAEPFIQSLKAQGANDAVTDDVRAAVMQWFDEEIKWEDLKSRIVDLYIKEFSEQELIDIGNFYQTPTGKKALAKLPALMQQGAQVGQQYAMAKQEALQKKLQVIVEKYGLARKAPPAPPGP